MTKTYRHWARAGSFAELPREEVQRRIRTKQQAKSVMYLFRKHGFTRWVRER